jgi:hypothetical protein
LKIWAKRTIDNIFYKRRINEMTDVEKFETTQRQESQVVPEVTEDPRAQQINIDDTVVSYVVGLQADGNFFWQVYGQRPGLAELIGIHDHATTCVNREKAKKTGSGDALTAAVVREVQALNQKLDLLMNKLVPKKPDNVL